jgi:hypothetical protein
MPFSLHNPYNNDTQAWLKGNLHTHTTKSDGNLGPQETIDTYAALGYDFLMISDHDLFTPMTDLDPRGMVLIPGNEITALGEHILHVNAHRYIGPNSDRQAVIRAIQSDGGFAIVCHPNWLENYNHCPQELLEAWEGYTGIEIYNGVSRRAQGSPYATDRWDRLLASERRVWGYANDDNHKDQDRGVAWNYVQAEKRNAGAVARALREGRVYASTGVVIERIHAEGKTVTVETQNGQCHYVYSDHSRLQARVEGPSVTFTVPDDFPWHYIRFETFGPGDAMGWTQPFFIERS